MPQEINKVSNKAPTVEEIKTKMNFSNPDGIEIRLRDINKTYRSTAKTYNKETLRSYLQNVNSHESDLRGLSWFLYYRSLTYSRIVNFYANMFCLDARTVIPKYDLAKKNNDNKILKAYQTTIEALDKMRLQQEFYNIFLTCFIQDIYYGIYLEDDTGVLHLQIPADYCKIIGKYTTGDFSFAIDTSYLKNRQELIEYIPDVFGEIWKESQEGKIKWIEVPEEYAVCMKFRSEDYSSILPPFIGLFNAVINLSDLEDIQAAGDEASVYKMLWFELETLANTKNIDDWKVNPELAIPYFKKFSDELPDYIASAIVPGQIHEIDFDNDKATDTTKVAKATEQVLNTAGGAEILNGSTINNTYAFKMAAIANTEYAISSLLPQLQSWVTRMLKYRKADSCKVKFMPISVYTKADYREQMLSSGQYGLPTKLAINTLNGYSEKDTVALNYLEENILELSDKLVPLNSSYTQSGKDNGYTSEVGQGRPQKDVGDLSDSGERSRANSGG